MSRAGYYSNNINLNNVFQLYKSGTKATNTNIKINGNDLSNIYAPYTTGTKANTLTIKNNGSDLSNIFSKKTWYGFGTGTANVNIRFIYVDTSMNFYTGGDFFRINGITIVWSNGSGGAGKVTGFGGSTVVSTSFAQGINDTPFCCCTDLSGNIYLSGYVNSFGSNLDHTTGQVSSTSAGASIGKYDITNNTWSIYPTSTFGASGADRHLMFMTFSKVSNNILYICGKFTTIDYGGSTFTGYKHFAKWDGSAWSSLGFFTVNSIINKIDVDKSEVIYILDGSTAGNSVVRYTTTWNVLTRTDSSGNIIIPTSSTISDICVDSNDDLWAVGTFYVAKFIKDTGYWVLVGNSSNLSFVPTCISINNGYIYVAGGVGVAYYDPKSLYWSSNLVPSISAGNVINKIFAMNYNIYVSGTFTTIDGGAARYIAVYS